MALNPTSISEFWRKTTESGWLDPNHPGKWGANPIGLYGDDAKYTRSGEKFISCSWNALLQESSGTSANLNNMLLFLFDRYFVV